MPHLVGDQHGGLLAEQAAHALLKDVLRGVVVHSGQGVVEQDEVARDVGGARKVEALALAARQVDAAQAGLGLVAQGQDLQVELQGAGVQDLRRGAGGAGRGGLRGQGSAAQRAPPANAAPAPPPSPPRTPGTRTSL